MPPETSAPPLSPMQKIWHIVALIPEGRVASYGKIADYAGLPGRARYVSRALKQAPDSLALPWHRVINSQGKISFAKDTHPFQLQMSLLRSEGVQVNQAELPCLNMSGGRTWPLWSCPCRFNHRRLPLIRSLLLLILLLPLPLWAQTSPLAPHTAEYQVNYGEINLGGARFMLLPPEGDFYQYKLDSDLSLLVLSDKRHIRSEFTYQDGQLTPLRFSHQRTGTGPNFNEQIAFAKEQGKIFSRYKDEKSKLDYSGTLYDA